MIWFSVGQPDRLRHEKNQTTSTLKAYSAILFRKEKKTKKEKMKLKTKLKNDWVSEIEKVGA